jgi:UDP-N-acetylglucosamine 2-epimerase
MLPGISVESRHLQIGRMVELLGYIVRRAGPGSGLSRGRRQHGVCCREAGKYTGVPVVHVDAGSRTSSSRGPVISDLGRQLIGDEGLGERLDAIRGPNLRYSAMMAC